jgi:hypothetical protein
MTIGSVQPKDDLPRKSLMWLSNLQKQKSSLSDIGETKYWSKGKIHVPCRNTC